MGDEVELVSDGEALAVIGDEAAVDRFVDSVGLASMSVSLDLGAALGAGSSLAQAASDVVASSGRWVRLTEESAQAVKQFGLMETKTPGVSHAMIGQPGEIKQWVQIATSPTSMVTNPAVLAGAAGIMAQLAMKQQMEVITDYLAAIDEKLDDVLRAQTNQVLARMDGVALAVQEAMTVRDTVGRVSEVTWSKVQHQSGTVLETQGYAVRQLSDLADKLERATRVGDLAKVAEAAEADVEKWLAVLARCFQLHDAIGVLELDRVLDASPEELDRHRLGLTAARQDRLELMRQTTDDLLARMGAAVGTANAKVLFNPTSSPAIVRSRNRVAEGVHEFHHLLGIESGPGAAEARRWKDAAGEQLDRARVSGSQGLDRVKGFSSEARGQTWSAASKLSAKVSRRRLRRSGSDSDDETNE